MKRLVLIAACALGLPTAAPAQMQLISPEEVHRLSQAPATPRKPRAALLPARLRGWTPGPAETFGAFNASTLAGGDAAVLVEYGFEGAERRTFTRGPQSLVVEALRFRDSSGSYGAYSFYRDEEWETRDGPWQIAVRGSEVLLRKDEAVVRARLAGGGILAGADVDGLAEVVATAGGGPLPSLPTFLPEKGLRSRTRKYILGPVALKRIAPDLPPSLVDFDMGAEAVLASYRGGLAMLLVSYPTPQLAALKIRSWQQSTAASGSSLSSPSSLPVTLLYARRIGSLVSFVTGASSQAQADSLLQAVNYSVQIMWNERVPKAPPMSLAQFFIGVAQLIGVLVLFAMGAGLGFGLLRVFVQNRYPNLIFERPEETEIIRLNIRYSG